MGFNSGLVILNDRLHDIETNPLRFTHDLCRAIKEFGFDPKTNDVLHGSAKVFHVAHADDHISYTIGRNTATPLTRERIQYEAELLGYRLTRIKK